jgi:hypothetical protein
MKIDGKHGVNEMATLALFPIVTLQTPRAAIKQASLLIDDDDCEYKMPFSTYYFFVFSLLLSAHVIACAFTFI